MGAGRAQSRPDDDDDDDDEDEDWNVYDDFNNNNNNGNNISSGNRQARDSYTPSTLNGDAAAGAASNYAGSDAGYFRRSLDPFASTPGFTPASEYGLPKQPVAPGTQRHSTLLNAESFGFDVRNADPRNPNVLAYGVERDGGLHPADSHLAATHDPDGKNDTGIELVTVPALGQEFSKEEMRDMSRRQKRKNKTSRRKRTASRWGKGEHKICGWLSPRLAVFFGFIFCVLLGVTLFFVIPRVPDLAFLSTNPLEAVPNSASMVTNYAPTNFSMTMNLNLRADNTGGWIPSRASKMKVEVTELTTNKKIGEGTLDDMSFPGRKKTVFQLPVHFEYRSLNLTGDPTFQVVHDACAHRYTNVNRPFLNLGVKLSMNIVGLIGKKATGTHINTPCPFELQPEQ
ncbi:unnamed protein product [Parajaminaea phylloscopi]